MRGLLPTPNDYQQVLQNPQAFLGPRHLKECRVERDPMGMPKVRSGGFALTYRLENHQQKWALRCFHKPVPEREHRYTVIRQFIKDHPSDVLVPVEYAKQGVLVKGNWYPVTVMEWVEGDTLNNFIYKNINSPSLMTDLVGDFRHVVGELERLGIAHGDLSQLNILIRNGKMLLVDYDGMFVPGLAGQPSTELGNPHFQHPRRTANDFNSSIDRFSEIVLYLTLQGLALNPRLYKQFGAGGEGIIFKQEDFKKPHTSKLLMELEQLDRIKQNVQQFRSICLGHLKDVPQLTHFLENRVIEIQVADEPIDVSTPSSQFLTISSSQRGILFENDGEYATVIGRVTQVHHGFTVKKAPRVFFNFGDFRSQCFTVVLWSEVLELFKLHRQDPDDYEYKWVAVTGLISSFENEYGARPQIILDTPANIEIISDAEAQARLSGKISKPASRPAHPEKAEKPLTSQNIAKGSISSVSFETVTGSRANSEATSPNVEKATENPVPIAASTKSLTSLEPSKMSLEISEKVGRLYSGEQQVPGINSPAPTPAPAVSMNSIQAKPISNVAQPQPVKSQQIPQLMLQPVTKQVTPKKVIPQKKAFSPWLALGVLLFIPLAVAAFFLPTLLNLPQRIQNLQATPTRKPAATATFTKSAQLPPVVPTKVPDCIPWDEITAAAEGKTTCVYGEVTSSKDFPPEGLFSYTLVRFSDNQRDFYLIAHDRTLLLTKAGDCLTTTSIVSVDANGVPFMEPSKIETNKYSCMK